MRKMKDALCQVHEFIADSEVTSNHKGIDSYSKLILRLSSSNGTIPFSHQFSMINIKNRIIMLNQSKTNKMKILKFLFVLPVVTVLMMVFSFTDKPGNPEASNTTNGQDLVIGNITWEGNSKYTDAMLSKFISPKTGDKYNKELIEQSMLYKPSGDDLGSLYMNNGFLYFNIEINEEVVGDIINLTFVVYEGNTVAIDKIIIKGNGHVSTNEVMEMLEFKKGELFDRSKLIQSQKNIAESGFFVSDSIMINPIPHDEGKLVDIEFVVTEI